MTPRGNPAASPTGQPRGAPTFQQVSGAVVQALHVHILLYRLQLRVQRLHRQPLPAGAGLAGGHHAVEDQHAGRGHACVAWWGPRARAAGLACIQWRAGRCNPSGVRLTDGKQLPTKAKGQRVQAARA